MKKIMCTCAALVILGAAFSLITACKAAPPKDADIIAWVKDEPVSVGEYRLELAKNYTAVLTKAVGAGGIQGKKFWTTKITVPVDQVQDGNAAPDSKTTPGVKMTPGVKITPLEMLKAAAMETSVRRKIIQIWAREYGIEKDISWQAFLDGFHAENQRRQDAKSRNEPVYGPEQYTLSIYYDLELSETEFQLKQKLETDFPTDENELQRLYDTEYRARTYNPGSAVIDCAYMAFGADAAGAADATDAADTGSANALTRDEALQSAKKLRQALLRGEEMEKAAVRFGMEYRKQGINLMRMPAMGLPRPLQEAAMTLPAGSISETVDDGNYIWVFKCITREEARYADFDSVRPVIVRQLLEKDYASQVENRMKDSYKINKQVYAKITRDFIMHNSN